MSLRSWRSGSMASSAALPSRFSMALVEQRDLVLLPLAQADDHVVEGLEEVHQLVAFA